MAASLRNFVFGCILLLSIQQVALAVVCYSCSACDTVSGSTATDNSSAYCYKAVGSISSITVVSRGASSTCLSGSTTYSGFTASYYCCSTDRCNSGLALSSSLGLAFALVAVVRAVKWMIHK